MFQSLPPLADLLAAVAFLQIGMMLLITGKRYLRAVSVAFVSLLGGIAAEGFAAAVFPPAVWVLTPAGLVGGALLGYFLRPIGVGASLAYLGGLAAAQTVGDPLVQWVVALDLFAYGLLLTDLAPTLVTSMIASFVVLFSFLWTGTPLLAAMVLAAAAGAARVMASTLPSRLAVKARDQGIPQVVH